MAHTHPVIDRDTHFIIDGATRSVKNATDTKSMLVQYDHNSERFTFEVPRYVDEHDLSLCNVVRVHYINIEKSTRAENTGVDPVTDLDVCPHDDDMVMLSWLIPAQATQLVGSLHFVIQFACCEDDKLLYSWNTAKHTSVMVTDGIYNGDDFVEEYSDILEAWRLEIESGRKALEDGLKVMEANRITNFRQTKVGTSDGGENEWELTLGDGRTQTLKIKNGSRGATGATGLVGSIETVDGKKMDFFHGKKDVYDSLPQENLFAVITDDPDVINVNELITRLSELEARPTPTKSYMVYVSITKKDFAVRFNYIAKGSIPTESFDSLKQSLANSFNLGSTETTIAASGVSSLKPVIGFAMFKYWEDITLNYVQLKDTGASNLAFPSDCYIKIYSMPLTEEV